MDDAPDQTAPPFPQLNRGYRRLFRPGRLSLGLVVPLEAYPNSTRPTMGRHLARARLADELGFAGLWLRDVPFDVPSFGDAGQLFDPFVYLGALAVATEHITLATGSLILPLRHPAHVAKAAASADQLSQGRVVLGVASGDRPSEYPALAQPFPERGRRFREAFDWIEQVQQPRARIDNSWGALDGSMELLPRPTADRLPLLITGGSQQSPQWLADHGDGWMIYPQPPARQQLLIERFRDATRATRGLRLPVMQPLYLDLLDDPDAPPRPIHLGFRAGARFLLAWLEALQQVGVNHVALNLRFQQGDLEGVLRRIARHILPHFPAHPAPQDTDS